MWLLVVYVELPAVSIVLWLHVIVHMRAGLTTEQIFSPVECVCGLESTNRLNVLRHPTRLLRSVQMEYRNAEFKCCKC